MSYRDGKEEDVKLQGGKQRDGYDLNVLYSYMIFSENEIKIIQKTIF